MDRNFKKELDEMLEAHGGLYTFEDILTEIAVGRMQSFKSENTWLVTQIHDFPRKKVLEIVLVAGSFDDLGELEEQLLEFKEEVGADLITASARLGFSRRQTKGWKAVSMNFVRL